MKKNIGTPLFIHRMAHIAIARSLYNNEITEKLLESCLKELKANGLQDDSIKVVEVPGAFELPYACQKLALFKKYDAIIALGAIIRGETPHFDFIAQNTAQGIMDVSLKFGIPVIFGVLTTNNPAQAKARVKGGKRGDKGKEAARTALKLLTI
ncbi:6,7-dimethyl-8-ribityllumazine synthase [Candidatus Peregrinibacteria bacterium]|nr:6,7-dimethyl-8-ribityllumazine synthase [Candidatus Peregrinibacteria bacterium]